MKGGEKTAPEDRVVKEFLRLVRIPSPSRGERRMADYVLRRLGQLGVAVEEDRAGRLIGGTAGNLLARLPGSEGRTPILFVAHLDTRGGGAKASPHLHGDRIVGDGSRPLGADDKAGVAILLETVRLLVERRVPHAPLEILFTVGEEVGLMGAKVFNVDRLKAGCGFVFDAPGPVGSAVLRGPAHGVVRGAFLAHVRSRRWGRRELGSSPARAAAAALAGMGLKRGEPGIEARILSIGGFARGEGTMSITAEVVGYDSQRVWEKMDRIGHSVRQSAESHRLHAEVQTAVLFPAMNVEPAGPVVLRFCRAARRVGVPIRFAEADGGSDAHILNARGLPTIALGVGYEDAHSLRESVEVRALADGVRLALALAGSEGE
ncbi:peptidase M20 [Kyrpidia tusciae DSM 2912]|uniref:Peptidase M20 n=1 Tax=Kyrpidia tusciae (strain DSM 2912 / NBRC 15312 / T2) TaxID=562970 RepID=D5WXY0_KYRT2|nr:peptidase M20 [Kyrpidia tusciae DSM 2912]